MHFQTLLFVKYYQHFVVCWFCPVKKVKNKDMYSLLVSAVLVLNCRLVPFYMAFLITVRFVTPILIGWWLNCPPVAGIVPWVSGFCIWITTEGVLNIYYHIVMSYNIFCSLHERSGARKRELRKYRHSSRWVFFFFSFLTKNIDIPYSATKICIVAPRRGASNGHPQQRFFFFCFFFFCFFFHREISKTIHLIPLFI